MAGKSMVNVLVVDDDDASRESICRGLANSDIKFAITCAEDGREALEILRGQSPGKHVEMPVMVLLDLEMPRMNGFAFLDELRADPKLKNAPVFILSSSDAIEDKARALSGATSGYLVKSEMGAGYKKLPTLLESFLDSLEF
jgi:CheY-like chemotaxis protein